MSYSEFAPKPNPYNEISDFRGRQYMLSRDRASALDTKLELEIAGAASVQRERYTSKVENIPFRNSTVAQVIDLDSFGGWGYFRDMLQESGTFDIPVASVPWTEPARNGTPARTELRLVGATESGTGEMVNSFWIRDQARIAKCWLEAWDQNPERFGHEGREAREIILSLLTLMSSEAQLDRFSNIIGYRENAEYLSVPHHHPYIFFDRNNLDAQKEQQWGHRQDAWQMLVVVTFEAIQLGAISIEDLTPAHKQFLGVVAPYLNAVKSWQMPNSGSWEEIEAVRSSTLAWNIQVLRTIEAFSHEPDFEFLQTEYNIERNMLEHPELSLSEMCQVTIAQSVDRLSKHIPFESPDHQFPDSLSHREADGSLIYLLMTGMPEYIAGQTFPDSPEEAAQVAEMIEDELLAQIYSLIDPVTHGVNRYDNDAYQRKGFWSNDVQTALSILYSGESSATSDFSGNHFFDVRQNIVPDGEEAAWSHFNSQLSTWAGRKYAKTHNEKYLSIQRESLLRANAMITGPDEFSVTGTKEGCQVIEIPANRMPECYVRLKVGNEEHIVPGPFTPLNWGVAEFTAAMNQWEQTMMLLHPEGSEDQDASN